MIPSSLRVVLLIAVVLYFVVILYFLKKKSIELKYTLIWLFAGLILGVLVIFPSLLMYMARAIGIIDPMNALFVVAIGFIIAILMMLTSIVSRQSNKIRRLIQEHAILENKLKEIENRLDKR